MLEDVILGEDYRFHSVSDFVFSSNVFKYSLVFVWFISSKSQGGAWVEILKELLKDSSTLSLCMCQVFAVDDGVVWRTGTTLPRTVAVEMTQGRGSILVKRFFKFFLKMKKRCYYGKFFGLLCRVPTL